MQSKGNKEEGTNMFFEDYALWAGIVIAAASELIAVIPALKSNSVLMLLYNIAATIFSGVKKKEI